MAATYPWIPDRGYTPAKTWPPGRRRKPPRKPTVVSTKVTPANRTSVEAEADSIIAELLAELGLARDSARREAQRSAQQEIARAQALASALQSLGIPGQIQNIYGNSAQSLAGLASGFSGDVRGLASQQAAEQANMVSGTGQEGAVRNEGAAMGDVLYGTQGFIPARGLEQMGAAFASEAALQPGFALQFGQLAANKTMQDYINEVLPEFTSKEAEIRTKRPSLVAELKENRRKETFELYEAGLLTQRQLAKRLGLANWRKYPNVVPGAEQKQPKASASLSKALGYLVDEYGNPILNSKGRPIALPQNADKLDRFGSATAGYWAWNQETGEIINLIPPMPKTYAPRAPKGYQLKTLKDGSTAIFDPNTGATTVIKPPPKGSNKPKLTAAQRARYRSRAVQFAEDMANGWTDDDGTVVRGRSLAQALEELKKQDIPWGLGKSIVVSYYQKILGTANWNKIRRQWESITGKGEPARGGRKKVSYEGGVLVPGTGWNGTHVTDGLGWGTKTAIDYTNVSVGTPVGAPESGRIIRHGSAQGGQSLWFLSDSGYMYWLGHIDGLAPVGTRVKRGQVIAYISGDHPVPHLHIDRRFWRGKV